MRPGLPRRSAGLGLALCGGLGLGAVAGEARAAFQCVDSWGHRYVVPAAFSMQGGVQCQPVAGAERLPPELPAAATPGGTPQQAAAALGLPLPASRGGLTVSTDPGGSAFGPLIAPRLRLLPMAAAPQGSVPGPELRALVDSVARAYGLDAQLLLAIIHVESRFNPDAVSPKGAIGLMQVMPATAERVGVQEPQRTLFDPETNLHAGARYLRLLRQLFGERLELAVAAYNAGEGAVLRYQREIPPFRETQDYVRDVMAAYRARIRKGAASD